MKTDKFDIEQLLADVEHAGRDARRRDELAAMIDRMAEPTPARREPSAARHGFWWWSARVAAAACVLFFVTTAVRIWFIPTDTPQSPMVAEVVTPPQGVPTPPAGHSSWMERTADTPSSPHPSGRVTHRAGVGAPSRSIPQTEADTIAVIPEALPAEDLVAEEMADILQPAQDTVVPSTIESIVHPIVSIAYVEPEPEPQPQEPQRRNLLASLFRQPEPDDMTGTVLAFRIL